MRRKTCEEAFVIDGYPGEFIDRLNHAESLKAFLNLSRPVLVLISGPSGSGKTVLIEHLEKDRSKYNFIKITGHHINRRGGIWGAIAMALKLELGQEINRHTKLHGSIGTQSAGIGGEKGRQITEVVTEVDVEEALRKEGRVLIIDDFHFVPPSRQEGIVREIKGLVQSATINGQNLDGIKVVVLYIPTLEMRDSEVWSQVRPESIELSLWSLDDLKSIGSVLFNNQAVSAAALLDLVAQECFGLPSNMQRFCRQICQKRFHDHVIIPQTSIETNLEVVYKEVGHDLWEFIEKTYFELTENNRNHKDIIRLKDGRTGYINQVIWRALAMSSSNPNGNLRISRHIEISLSSLTQRIDDMVDPSNKLTRRVVHNRIKKMAEIAKHKYLDSLQSDDSFRHDPIFDYDREVLRVYRPSFLLALRHSPEHEELFRW